MWKALTAFIFISVVRGNIFVCESSAWLMTLQAKCLFTDHHMTGSWKKEKWRTACFSPWLFVGRQGTIIHTCRWSLSLCCGWKIYLDNALVLNKIRKLRDRGKKQEFISVSVCELECKNPSRGLGFLAEKQIYSTIFDCVCLHWFINTLCLSVCEHSCLFVFISAPPASRFASVRQIFHLTW